MTEPNSRWISDRDQRAGFWPEIRDQRLERLQGHPVRPRRLTGVFPDRTVLTEEMVSLC